MKQIGEHIYLSVEDLTEAGVSENTIYRGIFDNSPRWQVTNDPDDGRRRLVRYDTMADKYKAALKERYWGGLEPSEWLATQGENATQSGIEARLKEACETLYMKWMYDYAGVVSKTEDDRLRARQQRCLSRAAAVLEALSDWYKSEKLKARDSGPCQQAVSWLKTNQGKYFAHKYIPLNAVVLKDRLMQLWQGRAMTDIITLPRTGNSNRVTHKEDADVRAWCIQARMSGRNLTVAEIARRVRRACELTDKAVPSASWIHQLLSQPAVVRMIADSRWGVGSGRGSFYKGYIPTTRALYAGDCWQMDATRVNILPHSTEAGSVKKQRFVVICAVRDVYSGDVLGVSFGVSENRWMYMDALKMAVSNTGYLPYELVHDKFPGYNTEEIEAMWEVLLKMNVKRTITAVATGKAQTERWFGTWQSVFLNREKYYYGEGIKSTRPYAHRSPEYLAKLRKEANEAGFDFDAAWQSAWQAVCGYRNTPVKAYSKKQIDATPCELHDNCEKPHVRTLQKWETARMFWPQTTLQIRRNMVTLTVRHKEYHYAVPMPLLNQKHLTIRYNTTDLGTVVAFYGCGEVYADELKQIAPVNIYGPEADWGAFQAIKTTNKQYNEAQRAALRAELEGSRDLEAVLGEDTLLLGARVTKADIEKAEDAVLWENMATIKEALSSAPIETAKPSKSKATIVATEEPIDINAWIKGQI